MKYHTRIGDEEREYRFERRGARLIAHVGDREHELDLSLIGDGSAFSLLIDGRSHDVVVDRLDDAMVVQLRGERIVVEVADERELMARQVHGAAGGSGLQQLFAVMPGVVVEVPVAEGDRVAAGQTLVVLEAMKMQNPLLAEADGVVTRVVVGVGDAVKSGALLLEVDHGS